MLVLRTCIGGKPGHAGNNGTYILPSTARADGGSTLHSAWSATNVPTPFAKTRIDSVWRIPPLGCWE
jgi:hypothetical protein